MKILILILSAIILSACDVGVRHQPDGGIRVSDGAGSCTVYIIEKNGYKFAVAVGSDKCAITQIVGEPKVERP